MEHRLGYGLGLHAKVLQPFHGVPSLLRSGAVHTLSPPYELGCQGWCRGSGFGSMGIPGSVQVNLKSIFDQFRLSVRVGSRSKDNYLAEMCSGSEEGSYLRLMDFCITQL